MENHSCAIMGDPPWNFPWGFDEEDESCVALKLVLFNKITFLRSKSITDFYVVMNPGIGLYATEIINGLREKDKVIRLICIIPWEEQATKWPPDLRNRYFIALEMSDEVKMASTARSPECEITAMLNAIDAADHVIAIRGDENVLLSLALHYAERLNKQIERWERV